MRKGLSAGRVQSVATRIICDREEEINDFVPQEYWVITALLGEKKGFEARFYSMDGKKELTCKEEADAVLAASVFHFGTFSIREVKEYMASQGIPVRLDF